MSDLKVSSAKSIGFRPGVEFRAEVDALVGQSKWTITDIARVGLQAFWADISALVLASPEKPPVKVEEIRNLRDFIELCRSAQKRGVDPKRALTDAIEAKLTTDVYRECDARRAVSAA